MTSCFVCDKEVTDGVCLTTSETTFSKTVYVTKISEVVGNDYMVIAAEEDKLCRRCALLLNKSDKLEVDLLEINTLIKRFLDFKYDMIPKDHHWSESEIEQLKDENEQKSYQFLDEYSTNAQLPLDDDHTPELNESELENNTGVTTGLQIKVEPIVQEEENMKLNIQQGISNSTQNSSSEESCIDNVKVEYIQIEEICPTYDDIDCRDEQNVSEESDIYLTNETTECEENIQIEESEKNVTHEKDVKIDSKTNSRKRVDVKNVKDLKNRPILPKITKSSDILKLASMGVFEPIDTNQLIEITTFGSDQLVQQIIQGSPENVLDNVNTIAGTNNNDMTVQKKDAQNLFSCEVCGKECTTKNRLEMHKTVHQKKICDFCGRAFTSNYRLKVHRNIHTQQKKFICDICNKTFIHHSTFWYHRKWHEEPYPYSCEYCGKLFKHSSILAIHRRKHTGEKPYKCSYCTQAFSISTSLKKHEMIHTNEFPFRCEACEKGFTSRHHFVQHMNKKHKIPEEGDIVPNPSKKQAKTKSKMEEFSQSSSNSVVQIVDVDNSYEYFPIELEEGIEEIVVGSEKIRKYKDISIEIINQETPKSKDSGDQEAYQSLNADTNLPVELGDGLVEVVLGPDEYVLSEEMVLS